jgi:superfamily II DNA or RNA helicase
MESTIKLREWQGQAQTLILHRHLNGLQSRIFFLVAGVGSGKTLFAVSTVKRLFDLKYYTKVVYVSPQRSVRNGFVNASARLGMQIDYHVDTERAEVLLDQYQGLSLTYAGMESLELLEGYIDADTIVVLDEPHHLSYNANKGTASEWYHRAMRLLGNAGYVVLMTGTPYRTDEDEKIPFATYKRKGLIQILQSDYYYSYGQAVRDGVVAEVRFMPCYGAGMYSHNGIEYSFDLEDFEPNEDEPKVLKTLLEPNTEFVEGMINQAVRKLEEIRTEDNNYAGLLVCRDKDHARVIAQYLRDKYGIIAALVLDDEGDGVKIIDEFRDSTRKWIVAVKMVSEGTDIQRLKVCCYLSNVRTMMFFVQVKGRIARSTGFKAMGAAREYAYMYYPAVPTLEAHIRRVSDDVTDRFSVRDIQLGAAPPPRNPSDFEVLEASFSGEIDFTICEVTAEPVEAKAYKVEKLRKDIADLAKVYARQHINRKQLNPKSIGEVIAKVHRQLNAQIGVEHQEEMTLDELRRKADIILKGIEKMNKS